MATNIGTRIMERRKQLGWTQEDLAFRMGYKTKSAINKIELGINDVNQSKVVKFAEVMGTTVAYLMDWEETQKKNDTITDIVLRLEADDIFLEAVESLYQMDREKLAGLLALLQ